MRPGPASFYFHARAQILVLNNYGVGALEWVYKAAYGNPECLNLEDPSHVQAKAFTRLNLEIQVVATSLWTYHTLARSLLAACFFLLSLL